MRARAASLVLLIACVGERPSADAVAPDVVGDAVDSGVDDDSVAPVDSGAPGPDDTGTPPPIPVTPPPPAVAWASGSRLTVEVLTDGSGAAFRRFHDTLLDVPCTPELAEDAVWRCLPVGVEARTRYTDDACTDRVYEVAADACERAPYLRVATADDRVCGVRERFAVFSMRAVAAPDKVYRADGRCRLAGPAKAGATYHRLQPLTDAPVDPTGFVRFTEAVRYGPEGVGVVVLEGEDGSELVRGFATSEGVCDPLRTDAGPRCVPVDRAGRVGNQGYGAADCRTTPLGRDEREDECPDAVVVTQLDVAADRYTVFASDGVWTGPVHLADLTCSKRDNDGLWVARGDRIASEDFPELRLDAQGPGPLQERRWVDAQGTPLVPAPQAPLLDVATGAACRPIERVDGGWICLPEDAFQIFAGVVWFGDDACTRPVFQLDTTITEVAYVRGIRTCAAVDGDDDDRAFAVGRAFALGEAFQGRLYQKAGAQCLPSITTPVQQSWRFGDEVPLASAYPTLSVERR